MREEDEVLRHVITTLERLGISYAVGGSLASSRYGEPRATMDADILADVQEKDVRLLVAAFPSPEFYLSPEAAREAIGTGGQFNIIHGATGFKVDLFLPSDAMQRNQLRRARALELLPGLTASISPPEDLILKKLEYYRMGESPKHLRDIAAMLQISGEEIDRERIDREAEALELTELWTAVRRRADG